ncbi:MAG: 2Fe-2S iron-sulfur cluster-binding protein, partial [Pseudomonadota bacterium]
MHDQLHRLPQGGRIDRENICTFRFDGREYTGFFGDTLASALLANGVRCVGRSFKYHRARGIFSNGPEEPNALVELRQGSRREPNTRATTTELYDGLVATSQNRWPSLAFDVMGINQLLAPMLVAGFYYKTFKWPAHFWERLYEPIIRRAAGLGRGSTLPDPDTYDHAWAHGDVLIVGAGPAGLAAALAAGQAGARVILCDENPVPGGQLLNEPDVINDAPADLWVEKTIAELRAMPNIRILTRANVFGIYDGVYGVLQKAQDHVVQPAKYQPRQIVWHVVAKRVIVCAGAIERPIVFGDNDRPGIMLAAAMRSYMHRFAVMPGGNIAVYLNNLDGWRTVQQAQPHAKSVIAIVADDNIVSDARLKWAKNHGVQVHFGGIAAIEGGKAGVNAISLRGLDGTITDIACDGLGLAGGWNPQVGLTCNHRGKPVWDEELLAFLPAGCPPGVTVAGAANGQFALTDCLQGGHAQGLQAARDCGFA